MDKHASYASRVRYTQCGAIRTDAPITRKSGVGIIPWIITLIVLGSIAVYMLH